MGLRNKKRESNKLGPFRGPSPKGAFQTIDLGSRNADYIQRQARKFPKRKYAVADISYTEHGFRGLVAHLEGQQITVHAGGFGGLVEKMKSKGIKTRHLNLDMPEAHQRTQAGFEKTAYDILEIFEHTPEILYPNGKLYI